MRFSTSGFILATFLASTTYALQCQTEAALNLNDVTNLINDLNSNNINPPESDPGFVSLTAFSNFAVQQGTAKICCENQFLFENTHFKLSDMAFAAQVVENSCGSGGGFTNIQGDSGLQLVVRVINVSENCQN